MTRALRLLATLCVALGGWPDAAPARTEVEVGAAVQWAWPGPGLHPGFPYGPYPAYPYGRYGPWGPCVPGSCLDDIYVRRAVRRELQQQELRRELELRERGGYPGSEAGSYGVPRPAPPPTPDSHLQPRYRGSGEVLPEFRGSGQAR